MGEWCVICCPRFAVHFTFDIGEQERNTVEFNFNQLFGRTEIKVNGKRIQAGRQLFSEPLSNSYEFTVGEQERFVVRIEKQRRLLWSSKYRVFINRRLFQVHDGH